MLRNLVSGSVGTRVLTSGRGCFSLPPSHHQLVSTFSTSAALSQQKQQQQQQQQRVKTAIVMLNMGGPSTLSQVESFLERLFSDRDLIPLPFQKYAARFLAKRRSPKIRDEYALIGGGSPIRMWTERQGRRMAEILDEISPHTAPHRAYVGFRYAEPLTETAVQQVVADGAEQAVAFVQYPQYSCSTSGSSLNELRRCIEQYDPDQRVKWSAIDRWPTHPLLVEAFAERVQAKLAEYPEGSERDGAVIMFTAHSLPMTIVNRGDPYPAEVAATVSRVMERLNLPNPHLLVWQSQVGPRPWLGPRTDHALEGLAKHGHKNVVMVPIAFTSDHIETLFELDLEYGDVGREAGLTGLKRAESLNDSPTFINALADLAYRSLNSEKASPLLLLRMRCPACKNPKCDVTRAFFSSQSSTSS
ncbi:ferrochelatase-domain-containing protein [Ramicandelaber brevisporus]|nr:ferrochelatase-domain-containing protein [Ramicandelaber brevisporus]